MGRVLSFRMSDLVETQKFFYIFSQDESTSFLVPLIYGLGFYLVHPSTATTFLHVRHDGIAHFGYKFN